MFHIVIDFPVKGEQTFKYNESGGLLSLSGFRRSISTTKDFENQTVTATFDNREGTWSAVWESPDRYLIGRKLKVFDGASLIATFTISAFPEALAFQFKLKADSFYDLDIPVPRLLEKDHFPDILAVNRGKPGNFIFGAARDSAGKAQGMCQAYRVAPNTFHAAWHHLDAVSEVYDDGVSISYTVDNNVDGCCYIVADTLSAFLYFNASGAVDGDGNLITNPVDALKLINEVAAYPFNFQNKNAAAEVFEERGYCMHGLIDDKRYTFRKFLKDFSREFDCDVFLRRDGAFALGVLAWGDVEPAMIFQPAAVANYRYRIDTEYLYAAATRQYYYDFREKTFQFSPVLEVSSGWTDRDRDLEFRFHRSDDTCLDVAARALFFEKQPRELVTFEIEKGRADKLELTQVVKLKHPFSLHSGFRLLKILSIEYIESSNIARITALDIDSVNAAQLIFYDENDSRCMTFRDEADPECPVFM